MPAPRLGLRLLLVAVAIVLALLVLLGVDMGSLGDMKAVALAVLLTAVAIVVP
jgi:hypothetical protein